MRYKQLARKFRQNFRRKNTKANLDMFPKSKREVGRPKRDVEI
jgi:hypothetical protein